MNYIKILIKYISSFFKNDWQIYDYPLRYKSQKNLNNNFEWLVQVINWWTLCGLGKTKEGAIKDLRKNFKEQVKHRGYKPRPGIKVSIEYASAENIDENITLLEDFLEKVLGFSKNSPVFISDLSSLYDFSFDGNLEKYFDKIEKVYNKNVRHIKDGNISKILKAIKY